MQPENSFTRVQTSARGSRRQFSKFSWPIILEDMCQIWARRGRTNGGSGHCDDTAKAAWAVQRGNGSSKKAQESGVGASMTKATPKRWDAEEFNKQMSSMRHMPKRYNANGLNGATSNVMPTPKRCDSEGLNKRRAARGPSLRDVMPTGPSERDTFLHRRKAYHCQGCFFILNAIYRSNCWKSVRTCVTDFNKFWNALNVHLSPFIRWGQSSPCPPSLPLLCVHAYRPDTDQGLQYFRNLTGPFDVNS